MVSQVAAIVQIIQPRMCGSHLRHWATGAMYWGHDLDSPEHDVVTIGIQFGSRARVAILRTRWRKDACHVYTGSRAWVAQCSKIPYLI